MQAILIADHVYEDKSTGKKVVAGIFDRLLFLDSEQFNKQIQEKLQKDGVDGAERRIPGGMSAGSPTCYIKLTDVRGEQAFVLRYVYVNEDQVLFRTEFSINSNDPLRSFDVVLPLPSLPTGKTGTFALELVWHEDMIASYRVTVQEMPQTENNHDDAR